MLGAGGFTVENVTFYEKELLMRAVPQFVHLGWGFQKDIPRGGNNLQFRKLERPAANTTALGEGSTPDNTAVTWTQVTATVQQYGAWALLSDVARDQSYDDVVGELTEMWGEHMGDSLDLIARNVLVGGSTVQYAGNRGSRGAIIGGSAYSATLSIDALSEAEIREAVMTLKRKNAKRIGKAGNRYVSIVHPHSMYDFLGPPSGNTLSVILQNAGIRGETNPLFTGDAFDYLGVRFIETSNAKIFGSAATGASWGAVAATLVFGEQFYGESRFTSQPPRIIVKPVGSSGTEDPLDQRASVGWKASLAVRILNDDFAVRIEHGISSELQAGN